MLACLTLLSYSIYSDTTMKLLNSLISLIFVAFICSSCDFNVTTASIEDIRTCTNLENGVCIDNIPIFETTDPTIYVSCDLTNAPNNTLVSFVWKYKDGDNPIDIDEIILNSSDKGNNIGLCSNLSRPYNGWPVGKYEIEISIIGYENSHHIVYFEVR